MLILLAERNPLREMQRKLFNPLRDRNFHSIKQNCLVLVNMKFYSAPLPLSESLQPSEQLAKKTVNPNFKGLTSHSAKKIS